MKADDLRMKCMELAVSALPSAATYHDPVELARRILEFVTGGALISQATGMPVKGAGGTVPFGTGGH